MAHYPRPFFKKSRRLWYVQLDSKQYNLGPDREAAFRRYHELMRRPGTRQVAQQSVAAICDAFLEWTHTHRNPETYRFYRDCLQRFVTRYPELIVADVRIYHVQQCVDSFPHLSSGSKRNHCRAVQRAFRWAEEQGLIERSPLTHLKKPRAGRRETTISEEEFSRILGCVPNDAFRDLLQFAWHTGARAAECLALQRLHVELENSRIVFHRSEEKMDRAPRVIYLNEQAAEIVRRRLANCTGHVFTNTTGRPWTTDAVNCAFLQIRFRMGRRVLRERGIELQEEEVAQCIRNCVPRADIAARSGLRPPRNCGRKRDANCGCGQPVSRPPNTA